MDKNIICIKWGNKFNSEYVNRLFEMVNNNISKPYRFVCFTDDSAGINNNIEVKPLPEFVENFDIPDRGWRKLSLFNETLADLHGEALFLDLDVIVMGSLEPFFEVEGEFFIVKDWDFSNGRIGNSSVFRFEIGKYPEILENYYRFGAKISEIYRNEQAYLSDEMLKKGVLNFWNKDWCVSFKRHCLYPFPLIFFKTAKIPDNAKILVFHGRPTPEQAYSGYWGKGGFRYIKPVKWLENYCQFSKG